MTPGQLLFIISFGVPVVCVSILLSLFVEQDKMLLATIVVCMIYFVIGFVGYLRMYIKNQAEKRFSPPNHGE